MPNRLHQLLRQLLGPAEAPVPALPPMPFDVQRFPVDEQLLPWGLTLAEAERRLGTRPWLPPGEPRRRLRLLTLTYARPNPAMPTDLRLFGIRHHGPGSAASLVRALDAFRPDVLLLECPADAEAALAAATHPAMVPPVALLVYNPKQHQQTAFWPFATFSPERQVKHTARAVVGKVVREREQQLANPLRQAVRGALSRAVRTPRPRYREIDWAATIRANLRHYQPAQRAIIPEKLVGFGRRGQALREIVLCVDQSGSMAASVVYAGVFGTVLASIRAVRTHLVVFDTSVVNLSENLRDPVDLLFGVQLGGGTNINLALGYCQQLITRPADTILVLISDLYEGGNEREMLQKAAALRAAGVTVVALLALADGGAPSFDRRVAEQLAALDIPSFACTPGQFPGLMAAAIQGQKLG